MGYRLFGWIMHCVDWYYGINFNVFLGGDFMKRVDYEKMIDNAIEEFKDMDLCRHVGLFKGE